MSTNTLPPNWSGNDAEQHASMGIFRLCVRRCRDSYNRMRYRASVTVGRVASLPVGDALGYDSAAEARKAAYLALRILLAEASQAIDWQAAHGDVDAVLSAPKGAGELGTCPRCGARLPLSGGALPTHAPLGSAAGVDIACRGSGLPPTG